MSSQTILNLVIGVVILGLLIYRQLRPGRCGRPASSARRCRGLIVAAEYMQKLRSLSAAIVALAGSLVLAAVFGAVRAATVRIWMQDGQPWVQGNLLTAVLWVLALGAHLGYDCLVGQHKDIGGLGGATVILDLAVTLGVRRLIVVVRAQKPDPAPFGPIGRGAV